MSSKKNCPKGQPCGYTCISKQDNCIQKLSPAAQQYAADIIARISGTYRGKGGGAGSASLNQQEVEALDANRQFLQNSSPKQIIEAAQRRGLAELAQSGYYDPAVDDLEVIADAVYNNLPGPMKTKLLNKGSLAAGEYYDPSTGGYGGPNEARARFLVRRYIEQNGRDLYTGQPLGSIIDADLEHIESIGQRSARGQKADEPDNIGFTSKAVNQRKAGYTMADFYAKVVDKEQAKAAQNPNYWADKQAQAAQKQATVNAVQQLAAATPKNQWDDQKIEQFSKINKYYYAAEAMLDPNQSDPTRAKNMSYTKPGVAGRNPRGQKLPVVVGLPITKALAEAHRNGDVDRVAELEKGLQKVLIAASTESAAKGGGNAVANIKKQGQNTLMLNEWDKVRKQLGIK